jgi:hypothetical protein
VLTNGFGDLDDQKWHPDDSPRSPVFIATPLSTSARLIAQKLAADWYGGESFS